MFVYQIKVEYLGTNFVGWQIQRNGLSIQEVLEKILSKFFKRKISVIGSGRTDAGVHADEQSAHFKINKEILNKNTTINSLNFFLKRYPISILDIKKRKKNFHARHSAKERTYKYTNRTWPGTWQGAWQATWKGTWHGTWRLRLPVAACGCLFAWLWGI